MRIKGDKNRKVNFDFRWQRAPRLKLLSVPRRQNTSSFGWKRKFARRVQGVARGPLWHGAPFGTGPDWKQSVQSAKGRPCTEAHAL